MRICCLNNDLAGKAPTNHTHNYASSSHSHAWSSITSKPSTFTPSSHTHDYLPLSGGSTSGIVYLNGGATVPTDKGIHYGGDGATYPYIYGYNGKLYIKINNTYWVFGETGMTLNGTVKIS